ncbi:histidine kinase dimerization/phospho-acceptor domain-containing protein, partial [Enterococcus faecalis]|uniref:histidine kinase dimerization/phospho-acceptor domain-containing protein n=1 Tax=Enterococcus faecalis TaxID=1351 RepID=UPI003D6B33F4
TEVKQLQLSFEQMWQDLEEANAEREKYEPNRKELIANISHDLKTPITCIIGYVEGLMDGVANTEEKKQRYLTVIHEKS